MKGEGYTEKLRVRASGILRREDRILMVKLQSPVRPEPVWMPPGGAVNKGETLEKALKREMIEETGLKIETGENRLRLIHEFIEARLHAIEFYFQVVETGGSLELGRDPEMNSSRQILLDLRFIPISHFEHENIYPVYLRENISEVLNSDTVVKHIQTVR